MVDWYKPALCKKIIKRSGNYEEEQGEKDLINSDGNGPDDDNPGRRNDGGSFRGNIGTGI